jgi:DNA repair protein RecO (recombination protein O)
MLLNTKGIVLRATKYGETSLIVSIFTHKAGIQSYMLKGIRNEKSKTKRAGLLHHAALLDLVLEHKANRQLHHIREFQPNYIYHSVQEEVIKNAIATFCVELLYRLLPKEEEMEKLFDFAWPFFIDLDKSNIKLVGNYPLYFICQCGKLLGYNIMGTYSMQTPYLHAAEGVFSEQPPPSSRSVLYDEDIKILSDFLNITNSEEITNMSLNAAQRSRLIDWYIEFLQHHTQHLANLRSMEILKAILH